MKKTKVIHIVESLNIGGLERIVESLCLGMDKYKYDVGVYCVASGGQIADNLLAKGIDVKVLGIKQYYNPFNIYKLYKILKKDSPDIIQTHGYFSSVIGRLAANPAGIKVIINHVHNILDNFNYDKKNVFIDKFLNKYTDMIVFGSKACEKSFAAAGYDMDRSIVIYNGTDGEKYTINKNILNDKVITVIGTLKRAKGHIYLLKAMKRVLKDSPDIKLWIIGDGPLRGELEREVEQLGIKTNVTFWGKQNNVCEFLSKTSIFVLPSIREAMGVVLIEAVASALPVIGTNAGGVPEIIKDKENGLLVPPCDEVALCKAILDMFNNAEKLEKMGQASRGIFDRLFDLKNMINQLDVLYMNLLKKQL